jgi:hypothetical protein
MEMHSVVYRPTYGLHMAHESIFPFHVTSIMFLDIIYCLVYFLKIILFLLKKTTFRRLDSVPILK